jgi:hypothetical protein
MDGYPRPVMSLELYFIGRDSAVSIATRYKVDGPGIESWWGEGFSASFQTVPEANLASCQIGTASLSQG